MLKVTVVIIDDHPVVRKGLLSIFEGDPDIRVLADGESTTEAINLVQNHRPHVLLLDTDVHGQTFNLAKKLTNEFVNLRIVIMGDKDDEDDIRLAKRVGAWGFINKGMDGVNICSTVKKVASGQQCFPNVVQASPSLTQPRMSPKGHPLSPREVDVLCCVAHAMTAKEIAKDLHISVKTVDRHKANIMEKLSLRSQIELVKYAIRKGFVDA